MKRENDYSFFQNDGCKYFPCHKGVKEEAFNCLFCFCPLYLLKEDCGGNMSYASGIKDCTGCTKVHDDTAYEHVMSKMSLVMEGAKK